MNLKPEERKQAIRKHGKKATGEGRDQVRDVPIETCSSLPPIYTVSLQEKERWKK